MPSSGSAHNTSVMMIHRVSSTVPRLPCRGIDAAGRPSAPGCAIGSRSLCLVPRSTPAPNRGMADCGPNTVISLPMAMNPPSARPETENGISSSSGTGTPRLAVKYHEMVRTGSPNAATATAIPAR